MGKWSSLKLLNCQVNVPITTNSVVLYSDCGRGDSLLCETCFTNSHHKTHSYTETIETRELGGFCDCGDSSSFPTNTTCQLHLPSSVTTCQDREIGHDDEDEELMMKRAIAMSLEDSDLNNLTQ